MPRWSNGRSRLCWPMTEALDFFSALVRWQRQHGRHDLPWQHSRDPYRVWLSEVMLQQTQVSTVLAYFPRFLARFPDVQTLAQAHVDEVLALWSGLGYYSRARHLHRAAQQVVQQWGGVFPRQAADLQTLSGVGRSTAAAIAAFCHGQPVSILDGNVRRVLARFLAFGADLAQARHEQQLWALAQNLLPAAPSHDDMASYTQALMDLGATVCTRSKPRCASCPVAVQCAASQAGQPQAYPVRTRRLLRRTETWWWLVLRQPDGQVWVQQRPARGIWGGLFCFPTFEDQAGLRVAAAALGIDEASWAWQPAIHHALTHRDLVLHPVVLPWSAVVPSLPDEGAGRWLAPDEQTLGLPAPVRTWLQQVSGVMA